MAGLWDLPVAQTVGSGLRLTTHNDTVTNVGKVSPMREEPV